MPPSGISSFLTQRPPGLPLGHVQSRWGRSPWGLGRQPQLQARGTHSGPSWQAWHAPAAGPRKRSPSSAPPVTSTAAGPAGNSTCRSVARPRGLGCLALRSRWG